MKNIMARDGSKDINSVFESVLQLLKREPFFGFFATGIVGNQHFIVPEIILDQYNSAPAPGSRRSSLISEKFRRRKAMGCRDSWGFCLELEGYVLSKALGTISTWSRSNSRHIADQTRTRGGFSGFLDSNLGRGELRIIQWDTHDQFFQTKRPYLWRKSQKTLPVATLSPISTRGSRKTFFVRESRCPW